MMQHKRYLPIFLILALFLTGCGAPQSQENTPPETQSSETPSAESQATETSTIQTEAPLPADTSVLRFLTDVNYNGKIQPSGEISAPGTLTDPARIPAADQTLVGQTVSILLSPRQEEQVAFFYLSLNGSTDALALVIPAHIPLLMILKPNFSSVQDLCSHIAEETVFQAEVLSLTNIDSEEGNYYLPTACHISDSNLVGDVVDVYAPDAQHGYFLGIVGKEEGEPFVNVKGGPPTSESAGLQSDFAIFYRTLNRFGLLQSWPHVNPEDAQQ